MVCKYNRKGKDCRGYMGEGEVGIKLCKCGLVPSSTLILLSRELPPSLPGSDVWRRDLRLQRSGARLCVSTSGQTRFLSPAGIFPPEK